MKTLIALFVLIASSAFGQSAAQCLQSGVWVPCSLIPTVSEAQAVNVKVSGGAGTTITQAFAGTTTKGNTIVCLGMESAAAIPVFTDADSNTYAVVASSATAPGYSIAVANNIAGTTSDIVTLTTTSGAAAFACHELKGAVSIGQTWDLSNGQQGTGSTITYAATVATVPGEVVLSAVGLGAGTVNATPSLGGINTSLVTVDASNTAVTGGAALSIFYAAHTTLSAATSFTQTESLNASQTYSGVLVSIKPPVMGTAISSALPTGTNVIGHVIADTGSTTAVTQATGTNLHAVLDTTSTTAVTQATGSNLHAVLDAGTAVIGHTINDSGSTTAVTGNPGVSQSGTWTVQPGNTANTTAWKVDNSAVIQPISIANGSDSVTGSTTDARNTATDNSAVSVVSILKQISASVQAPPLIQTSLRSPIPFALTVPLWQPPLPVYESRPAPSYDPCQGPNKANVPVSTSSNVQLIAGVAGRQIRICGGVLIVTTAGSFALVEGTGSVCATGIAGVIGSTTAASGPPLGANGGFLLGNGSATNSQANTPGNNLCILLTGTGLIAGNIEYAY